MKISDHLFKALVQLCTLIVFLLLFAIILSLVYGSRESLSHFEFFWSFDWSEQESVFGFVVPVLGTLIVSFIALLFAIPFSFGIAVFLTELCPKWLRSPLSIAVELLAAIPSIIYGMWGLFVFMPLFKDYVQPYLIDYLGRIPLIGGLFSGHPFGVGLFTAGLILSIMVIPFITSIMRDVFALVPSMMKESAYGLGCTKWEVMWRVVLPYTREGVISGIMLGLGRALGETMAVAFVIGNAFRLPYSIFSASTSIASAIANQFYEAGALQRSALMELGLLLFLITTIVLICSRLMLSRLERRKGGKA